MCDDKLSESQNNAPSPDGPDLSRVPASRNPNPPLSPTEQRVCALLLDRMTEQQVAEQLGRSPNTIHVHVRNIYRKLAIRTRQELFELSE